jgi:hypothetical protein
VLRVIERITLQEGTVSMRLGRPGRYELRVGDAKRRYTATDQCLGDDGNRFEVRMVSQVVPVGGSLTYKLVNTSTNRACVMAGASYRIERLQPDGTWLHVAPPLQTPFHAIGHRISPWKAFVKRVPLPAGVDAPGSYRVVEKVLTRTATGFVPLAPGTAAFTVR